MRRLMYVPMIHDEADIGGAGPALRRQSSALAGARRWAMHEETVCRFWESVAAYLRTLEARRMKVYQDGLPASGELGARIVAEAAARGSKNYQLVRDLLARGAQLCKTEDLVLLLREHENLLALVEPGQAAKDGAGREERRIQRDRLTEARDRFIAETIGSSLLEGDLGVLFIGAYHRVSRYLAADISVEEVKDPAAVQAYLDSLLAGNQERRLRQLGRYLASPVSAHLSFAPLEGEGSTCGPPPSICGPGCPDPASVSRRRCRA